MYNKGALKVTDPPCENCDSDGHCDNDFEKGHNHFVSDSTTWNYLRDVAYLPHSCDDWVVGGAAEIKEMIADLEKSLEELQTRAMQSTR